MRKVSSTIRVVHLSLGLLILSTSAFAGYNSDPSCDLVNGAAKAGAQRAADKLDEAAKSTSDVIAQAKGCVEQVISRANRAVPDFGGGIGADLSSYGVDLLAKQGCKMLEAGKSAFLSKVQEAKQVVQSKVQAKISEIPGIDKAREIANTPIPVTTPNPSDMSGQAQGGNAGRKSIVERLANIF